MQNPAGAIDCPLVLGLLPVRFNLLTLRNYCRTLTRLCTSKSVREGSRAKPLSLTGKTGDTWNRPQTESRENRLKHYSYRRARCRRLVTLTKQANSDQQGQGWLLSKPPPSAFPSLRWTTRFLPWCLNLSLPFLYLTLLRPLPAGFRCWCLPTDAKERFGYHPQPPAENRVAI